MSTGGQVFLCTCHTYEMEHPVDTKTNTALKCCDVTLKGKFFSCIIPGSPMRLLLSSCSWNN